MSDATRAILGASIVAGVVASAVASGTVDFRAVPTPSIQPRSEAFGIWSAIFPLLAATGVLTAAGHVSPAAAAALTASLATTCVWAYAVRTRRYELAASLLAVCTVLAWAALAAHEPARGPAHATASAGIGLYAGWLAAATVLSLAIADARADRAEALLAASVAVAVAGVALRQPGPACALAWACAWQRQPGWYTAAATVASVAGVVGAALA